MGRATQGVRLINIKGNDSIAAVTKVLREDEEVELDENGIFQMLKLAQILIQKHKNK